MTPLEAALRYAMRGWRVLALHTPEPNKKGGCSCGKAECAKPGKHPRYRKGTLEHGCHSATTDEATIRSWWAIWPNANVGIATGAESGILAVDADVKEYEYDGRETLAQMEAANGSLPLTVRQFSGSGAEQILFRHAAGLQNQVRFAPGLDVRTDGGLIVAPPSRHASGREYAWSVDHHPDDVALAPAPEWLIQAIKTAGGGRDEHKRAGTVAEKVGEGKRADTLMSIAGTMRRRGLDAQEIIAALLIVNEKRCNPPLQETEVQDIAASVMRYKPDDPDLARRTVIVRQYVNAATGEVLEDGEQQEPWQEPIPLYATGLPKFPVAALPKPLAEMAEAIAEALQVPVDLPAMLSLAVIATAAQGTYTALVTPGWEEVLSLWVAVAMESGELKGPAVNEMKRPIVEFERAEILRADRDISSAKMRLEVIESRISKLKKEAVKEISIQDREALLAEIAELEQSRPIIPKKPQYLADDATPEAIGRILRDQGGRVAFLADEGTPLRIMMGRYNKGAVNAELYLKGYSGHECRINRASADREPIYIPRTVITFGLALQPAVVADLAKNQLLDEQGFLARLCYAFPESLVGSRRPVTKPVPAELRLAYTAVVRNILAVSGVRDEFGCLVPRPILFSDEAAAKIAQFREQLEPQMARGEEMVAIRRWLSKLHGQVARIATLCHIVDCADHSIDPQTPVPADWVTAAWIIADYLVPHAWWAHFTELPPTQHTNDAVRILEWLKTRGQSLFRKRDVQQALRGRFPRAAEIDVCLFLLERYGYIRELETAQKTGRPSRVFEVHPSLRHTQK